MAYSQGCGVGVITSRRFLGGVGFLTTLGVRVGFFCPTLDVQLDHFLNHTLELGIPVEMVQFLLKLLLKQRFLAVNHISIDFNSQISFPFDVKELESGVGNFRKAGVRVGNFGRVGAGYFTADSTTLLTAIVK